MLFELLKTVLILTLAAVCLLSACEQDNKGFAGSDSISEQPDSGQQNLEQQNSEQPDKAGTDHDTRMESLFELKEYDGVPEIRLEWGDQQSPAQFHRAPLLPLGLYLPDQMEVYEFEDGNRWGYDRLALDCSGDLADRRSAIFPKNRQFRS